MVWDTHEVNYFILYVSQKNAQFYCMVSNVKNKPATPKNVFWLEKIEHVAK